MGSIDLDPFSCAQANEVVRATKYFSLADDGFCQFWHGNVFVNPPGGYLRPSPYSTQIEIDRIKGISTHYGTKSTAAAAWGKAVSQFEKGKSQSVGTGVSQLIFLGFNIELLRTSQTCHKSALDYAVCVPKKRLCFISSDAESQNSPPHANVIVYMGDNVESFRDNFTRIGAVKI